MNVVLPPPESSVLLEDVSWAEFLEVLEALTDHPGHRVAYDRGRLEIMSPTQDHERVNRLLGRLVETLAEVLGAGILGFGSWTLKRPDLLRGTEPDTCYYVGSVEKIRGKEVDLSRDPPPDLAIEVDVTRKSLDRLPIYSAIGVPEVWRHERDRRERLVFLRLDRSGQHGEYVEADESLAFPGLGAADLVSFLERRHTLDDTQFVLEFREWARRRFRSSGRGRG